MAADLNTFQEYHALKTRQRMAEEAEEAAGGTESSTEPVPICLPAEGESDGAPAPPPDANKPSPAQSITASSSKLLELPEVQSLVLLLIYVDLLSTTFLLLLSSDQGLDLISFMSPSVRYSLMRAVESFSGFTLFFFLLELGILLFTHGARFLSHAGYLLDGTILSLCL